MKPIVFSTKEVQAVLAGRMTVVRRPLFPQKDLRPFPMKNSPDGWWFRGRVYRNWDNAMRSVQGVMSLCRYKPGDILYVRETWGNYSCDDEESCSAYYMYRADYEPDAKGYWFEPEHIHFCDFPKWHSPVSMPKEATRIFLRVTNVSVTKLQDIITGDYKTPININREGLVSSCEHCAHNNGDCKDYIADGLCRLVSDYIVLRNKPIRGADLLLYGWDANPWTEVTEFVRISREEAQKNEMPYNL
jgi:hypothetical protein